MDTRQPHGQQGQHGQQRGGPHGGGHGQHSQHGSHEPGEAEIVDRLVYLNRTAKVVKGGRRFSFSALVVAGDGAGKVGAGLGKANEVPEAIRKGFEQAKKEMIPVPTVNGTIPHEVVGHFGSGEVFLRPAREGTGVIAGGAVRAVMESAGIHNVLTKCIGTSNPHNVVKATIDALKQLRSVEETATKRGFTVAQIRGES
jgi:small subunit ribosomal protein S5